MTAPAAHTAEDSALDACSALRADLAAPAAPAAGAAREGAWLLLVMSLERAGQLPVGRRAAHFRRARAVWDDAAEALGAPRYAEVGARLARWRTADPTLPLVKALLWTAEQPEAAGYTRLALAGYSALARLTPTRDVRHGYVLAQSARAVRTLGDLDSARERYEISERIGAKYRDRWLRVRAAIGLGATYHQHGNHPDARAVFRRVLAEGAPDPRFTAAAHQGLWHSATAANDNAAALSHAWQLLRASREGYFPRLDAWLLMADVCVRLGRFRAAARLAEASLRQATRPDDFAVALQTLVEVAAATGDVGAGRAHADALRGLVGAGAGAYDDVRSHLALAQFAHAAGHTDEARESLAWAREHATALKLHELVYRADQIAAAWEAPTTSAGERLSRQNARIFERVATWDCSPDAGDSRASGPSDRRQHATVQ